MEVRRANSRGRQGQGYKQRARKDQRDQKVDERRSEHRPSRVGVGVVGFVN